MERYQVHEYLSMAAGNFSLSAFDQLGLRGMIKASLDKTDGWEKIDCVLKAPLIMSLVLAIKQRPAKQAKQ